MAAVVVASRAAQAAQAAAIGVKSAQNLSIEFVGYDFVGLLVKIVFFQLAALLIAKYFEILKGGQTVFLSILKFFGFNVPVPIGNSWQMVLDFYTVGWNGIKYWDVIKLLTILIIAIELNSYMKAQKRLGGEPSPATVATFILIIGFFLIITLPEMIQRIKDANAMMTSSTPTAEGAPI